MTLVTVASHRRSGTHLMIDLLRNNFSMLDAYYISLRELHLRGDADKYFLSHTQERIRSETCIVKSHSTPTPNLFFADSPQVANIANDALRRSKVIYITRDVRDVLVSLFYYLNGDSQPQLESLDVFVRENNDYYAHDPDSSLSRAEYWAYHVGAWHKFSATHEGGVLFVSYEEILLNPQEAVGRIEQFLGVDANTRFIDVRRSVSSLPSEAVLSSTSFRRGSRGEWGSHFSRDSVQYVEDVTRKFGVTTSGQLALTVE